MRFERLSIAAIGAMGCAVLLWGFWIPAKATLAQALLQNAWATTIESGTPSKPWAWADTWPIAKLRIGDQSFIVLADAGGQSLAFGPSHVQGSALPGNLGTTVISAHRDTQFSGLAELSPGDLVELELSSGDLLSYRMTYSQVLPSPELLLALDQGRRQLVLVTCWPLGSINANPDERFAVFFEEELG